MHPPHPAVEDGQLIDDFQFSLASLQPSPASLSLEGVWLEYSPDTPPRGSNDELASQSLLEANGAQPCSSYSADSYWGMRSIMDNCRSAYPGDYGHNTQKYDSGEDGRGHTQLIPVFLGPVTSSLNNSAPLECLPNEVLLHVLGFLDVSDLLAASRVSCTLCSVKKKRT